MMQQVKPMSILQLRMPAAQTSPKSLLSPTRGPSCEMVEPKDDDELRASERAFNALFERGAANAAAAATSCPSPPAPLAAALPAPPARSSAEIATRNLTAMHTARPDAPERALGANGRRVPIKFTLAEELALYDGTLLYESDRGKILKE